MGSRTSSRYPHIDDFATHPTLNLISRASPEVLDSLVRNAFDSLRDNTEISDLHLHTQARDDSKSQSSRLDEIMSNWINKATENCHWLDRLSCDLNPITIVIFHMVVSILYRDYNLLETYRCSNRQSGIPSAAEIGTRTGPLGEVPGPEVLSPGPKVGNSPTDGNLGDESMAEKNTNTKYLWSGSRAALKPVVVSPAIALPNPKVILRHLLSELLQDTSFPQYAPFLIGDGMSHVESPVLDALTPSFNKFCEGPSPYSIVTLSNRESDSMYQGPAGYINIIGAGDGDDPELFRLYVGQALDLRARLEQHGDPNHCKRYPSLQYGIMDACNWPLWTTCYGQFPTALLDADPEMLYILLNILEKLGSLIFQTLPAPTLERYLPNDIKIIHPNVHLNVVSPLFQNRSLTAARRHIEESLGYLKDSQDPLIEEYYRKHANGNPLTTVILERVLEIKGNTPKNYKELPETLKSYLRSRDYKDSSST